MLIFLNRHINGSYSAGFISSQKNLALMKNCTMILILLAAGFSIKAQQGWWGAQLHRTDGGNIAFTFEWKTENGKPVWYIRNAAERIKVSNITTDGDSIFVQMPVFESQFRLKKTNKKLNGVWIKNGTVKTLVIPFSASFGAKRFIANTVANKNITGRWAATFVNSKTDRLCVAEFKQTGDKLTGTFLNATGDYRYLEGIATKDSLFLSCFDGEHAFLFTAKIENDHTITNGVYLSGGGLKENWHAVKDAAAKVPMESVAIYVKPGEESLHFTFNDLAGHPVSISDERFKNKVVVIQLMGSWCPNCMDETVFLSAYYNKNKQRGFEVIALAYEYSTNLERSTKNLQKFQARYNVQYSILNTGVASGDSLRTEKTLPELTTIKSFPSSVILDKKGKIRKLDTGFNGPGTGDHYLVYKKEFEELIDKLLLEK